MRLTDLASLLALPALCAFAGEALPSTYQLANAQLRATVTLKDGRLAGETLQSSRVQWTSDGGFRVEVVWNDWQAPGKANNGDVMVRFTAADFTVDRQETRAVPGGEELSLVFKGPEYLGLEVKYLLGPQDAFLRRRLRVFEYPHKQYSRKVESPTGHLLHALYTYDAEVSSPVKVLKAGGFGQPVALELGEGGAFAGLEWPAADNAFANGRLVAGQEMGEPIDFNGVWGESAVLAVTPDTRVKEWFSRYCDEIRVAKLRPYTLYNSWYDLRSAEYPRVKPHQVMNEENVLRIAHLVQKNMVEKHGITMDAFVLDDGWDVYTSAWELRKEQFPRGLRPIADELKKTGTRLGIWYGPTGGYSFHGARADWFRENGYEVTDSNMLSVLGPKYAALFEKRTTDMAREGVAYYKWDGIQFVDNNPANGGPIGIYGRRAAMKHVIRFCEAVRQVNPDMFLNVTSGTWLSPWWMKYADQIWMDGGDFGSADVPSISTRDSSITYRDMVLYEDFRTKDLWFPVSNLMTHGVLKGHIDVEHIGKGEPLSKFADEVVFYLARGVSMYELYIAPDILNDGEWKVLSDSLKWARANFDTLTRGGMIGGDPGRSQPYGHAHFKGSDGFLALRNPDIQPGALTVKLDPALGLDPGARDLVLERIYPTRWVAPRLYRAGETVALPLQGYEAAVYQIRPLAEVPDPLLADVVFEAQGATLRVLDAGPDVRVLNPERLKGLKVGGRPAAPGDLKALIPGTPALVQASTLTPAAAALEGRLALDASARQATLGFLLRPAQATPGKGDPAITVVLDGQPVKPDPVEAKGVWTWVTVNLQPGTHTYSLAVAAGKEGTPWTGTAQVWLTGTQAVKGLDVQLTGRAAPETRPLPPVGRGPTEQPCTLKLGSATLRTGN